jgi:alpha-beta hydrolase superfamily lysophospholipase
MTQPLLDRPEVSQVLFYPRRAYGLASASGGARSIGVEVEPGITLGGRLYPATPSSPAILFFHGNGEIAEDYDDIAPMYTQQGITLLVMDYRGYGVSGGAPTASYLLASRDAVAVFEAMGRVLNENGLTPARLYVMGRSLGSAAAIEIAARVDERLAGLIVESGFANTFALLARLGLQVRGADEERDGFGNAGKMSRIALPVLIIHGQDDVLIPVSDAHELHRRSASPNRQLVLIPHAGHNDLMMVGMKTYTAAIWRFVSGDLEFEER